MTEINGLKIAKPGFDVLNCDVKDQVFNSQHNSLKIWMTGNTDISVSAFTGFGGTGIGDVDIPHNLGYSPFYLVYFKLKHATKLWLQDSLDTSMLLGNYITGSAYSNDTNLHVHVGVNGNNLDAFTAVAYYKILIDKAYE
jgi:hypothetical protein